LVQIIGNASAKSYHVPLQESDFEVHLDTPSATLVEVNETKMSVTTFNDRSDIIDEFSITR
ncbi:MAG: hypothetical protein FWD41_01100, partial [Actinomycetia bacterium]|nr:hypothetical protein [Actinomycetes bacterium]